MDAPRAPADILAWSPQEGRVEMHASQPRAYARAAALDPSHEQADAMPEAVGRLDRPAAAFASILFPLGSPPVTAEPPAYFVDLNIDQIITAVTTGKEEYDLRPFFHVAPLDRDTIDYRQEVMRDLVEADTIAAVKSFADGMREVRQHIQRTEKDYYKRSKEAWFLDAVVIYCNAVSQLEQALRAAAIASRGLRGFSDYLTAYVHADRFGRLSREAHDLATSLVQVRYCVVIKEGSVGVRHCGEEPDYSVEIEKTFARFRQGDPNTYTFKIGASSDMNHVEAAIVDRVALLYPDLFDRLSAFFADHTDFMDPTITRFDREIQFYVAYLDHIAGLRRAGLPFCYPQIARRREVRCRDGFDLALADKLLHQKATVVCNDFHLQGEERIFVVSGPNQGGKTTFARLFGQIHYLGSIGCPVPGREATVFLFDQLFTHFERGENVTDLRGKLYDDLVRIHAILRAATANSIIILNEIFNSTTLRDAVFLSVKVMEQIARIGAVCVCVTFIDELASLGPHTVSMMSTVVPEDPTRRTFKIVRKPADGLAHALSIAEKYRLTYARLKERLRQ